ncbi:MAG: tautomerase family protein [Actinomycetota bacterium]
MPVIRIITNVSEPNVRREVATELTHVFQRNGVPRRHIATMFINITSADVYTGDASLVDDLGADVRFAFVEIGMSPDREETMKRELATAIVRGFAPVIERKRIAIDFVARPRSASFIGTVPMARPANGRRDRA